MASAVWASRSSAYLKKMSPSTGEAYSDAFSPELASKLVRRLPELVL